MKKKLEFQLIQPDNLLVDFVYCFSSLQNFSDMDKGIIFPNGKIDLIFSITAANELSIALIGLETKPKYAKAGVFSFFSISFHPLAFEYIFKHSVAELINTAKLLPKDFWSFCPDDLKNFERFCAKATKKINELLPNQIDERKRQLFQLVFASNGEITVKELSEKIFWNPRQINRYFSQQFGLSLKEYCKIIRFQASLEHISEGKLYPQLNFSDQSHFIKEVKHLSGVSPKELYKNENDRFLQFLAHGKK